VLRIARTKKSVYLNTEDQDDQHFAQYQQLTKLIKKHLSSVAASVFAQPVLQNNSDDIEWYSDLHGQPEPLLSLSEEQQLKAKKLLSDRLTALTKLADQLPQLEPDSEELQTLLKKAVQFPGDKSVYVVNDQPVITFWGVPDPSSIKTIQTVQNTNTPLSQTPALPITNNESKPRIPRFLSYLGWLLLFTLLAGLLWYWFSKHPVNWQDYNPFVDQYQIILDQVSAAGDDCVELERIYKDDPLLHKTEEKFTLLKKQVESKLDICQAYEQLKKEIEFAQGDCKKLVSILNQNQYLQDAKKPFIDLKNALKKDVQLCAEYQKLKFTIDSAHDDCPLLSQLNIENPYLKRPEGMFVSLKKQVEENIIECNANKTQAQIDSAKEDCNLLKLIDAENTYLQQPKGMFVALKQQLDRNIQDCNSYQTLKNNIDKSQLDCKQLKKIASENKALQKAEGKFIELKQQLLKYQKNCKRKQIENIVNLCPGERPKKLAPELVIVFDASGSMAYPPDIYKSRQIKQKMAQASLGLALTLFAGGKQFAKLLNNDLFRKLSPANKSRMQGAKTAVNKLVQKTPGDMDIGLVVLKDCPGAKKYGFYSPTKRQQLLGIINRLNPEGGTPLGNAIHKAGQMIDGVNKPATMVVISDGEESCGSNPCVIARKLAAQKPYLTINVVDILGTGAGNCVAKATPKGKVYTAHNLQDIVLMTEKAASSAIPKNCRK
jgi:hypothetical protein